MGDSLRSENFDGSGEACSLAFSDSISSRTCGDCNVYSFIEASGFEKQWVSSTACLLSFNAGTMCLLLVLPGLTSLWYIAASKLKMEIDITLISIFTDCYLMWRSR